MTLICGIDEAGRGPVIGPLVVAGVAADEEGVERLKNLDVKDSKLLSVKKREELYEKIVSAVLDFEIVIVKPKEIDDELKSEDSNLNWLEAKQSSYISNKLKAEKLILDCPSPNIKAYSDRVMFHLLDKSTEIVSEHKADEKYAVVSAASILAKVTRDKEIKKIQSKIKEDIGSGYPSDPKTKKFLKKHYKDYPGIFRKTWSSYKNVVKGKKQSKLGSFLSKIV